MKILSDDLLAVCWNDDLRELERQFIRAKAVWMRDPKRGHSHSYTYGPFWDYALAKCEYESALSKSNALLADVRAGQGRLKISE